MRSLDDREGAKAIHDLLLAHRRRYDIAGLLGLILAAFSCSVLGGSSTLDRIRVAGEVRVCIWPEYYSISYRNPRTQVLTGIDIELAKELAGALVVKPNFIDSSFVRLVDDVNDGRCDIAMFAIGITPLRSQKLRFTSPHLASDIYAIASKTNSGIRRFEDIDQPGVVIAVARGTLHEPVMKEKIRKGTVVVLDTPFAREQEVQAGRADVFMTDYPYSQRFLVNAEWARLVPRTSTYHVTPYAFAMKLGDDGWYDYVESFIRQVKADGRLRAAAERNGLLPILAK